MRNIKLKGGFLIAAHFVPRKINFKKQYESGFKRLPKGEIMHFRDKEKQVIQRA